MKKTLRNGVKIAVITTTAVIALSGCSPQKTPETEAGTEAVQVIPEKQTEAQTEKIMETETEKNLSLKDIQVSVKKSGRKGSLNLQIDDSLGSKSISQTFQSSQDAFLAEESNGDGIYMGTDKVMYEKSGIWEKIDSSYQNFFNIVYDSECEKKEDTEIEGKMCYHLSAVSDDAIGAFVALCYMSGYTDVIEGSTKMEMYINKETNEFSRIDIRMPFLATAGDGSDVKGEVSGSIIITGDFDGAIAEPEEREDETEPVSDYSPGSILSEKNAYQNQQFEIQVLGKELFSFDSDKTQELKANYVAAGSRYQEEAYGNGDGVIVNISSVSSKGSSAEDIIKTYLADSSAENISAGSPVSFAGNNYATSTATINNTLTKTYCTGVDGQDLILTVYYTDESTISEFESSCIYNTSENPYWEPETWTLEGKYQITTPSGYSIVKSESGELYACMSSAEDEVNVFAIEGSSIESEAEKETQSSGNITREVVDQEEIPLADGSSMQYYTVFNTEPNLTYYTHVALLQKDTAVIKFYEVSTAENADFKNKYTDFANNISAPEVSETETESESETTNLE